jgi:two-component system OmpR family sensor kinase
MIRRLSSRHRLTLQITAALLVLWFAIGWLTVHSVERRVYADVDEKLVAGLPETSRAVEVLSEAQLRDLAAQASSARDTALLVFGADGLDLFLPSGRIGDPDPAPDLGHADAASLRGRSGELWTVDAVRGSGHYRIVAGLLADGRVIVRAQPLADAEGIGEDVRAVLFVACVATVLGAAALVWLISRQALRPLEAVITTAHDVSDGTLDARVAVTSNAPDVVRLADALNTMLARIQDEFDRRQRTEAHLRQFVADASHELRTPLAAIIGFGELYQQHAEMAPMVPASDATRDQMVTRMLGEADRMNGLVEELLTLARLDEGQPLVREDIDLAALVTTAVTTIETTTPSHHFDLHAEPVDLAGDGQALRQLVDNLLRNVVAHTPDGTTAHVTVRRDGADAVLLVADDGPGLAPDDAANAFQRFWRAAPDRGRPGGTGLGLAIVAEIAHAHGGAAVVVTPSDGLTIEVRLPGAQRLP